MKLNKIAKIEPYPKTIKVPPGSDALIIFSMTISLHVYPKTKIGMIFMISLIDILPKTADIPITAERPHLLALIIEMRSIVMLIDLSKPVIILSQKEYIRTCNCQHIIRQSKENMMGVI